MSAPFTHHSDHRKAIPMTRFSSLIVLGTVHKLALAAIIATSAIALSGCTAADQTKVTDFNAKVVADLPTARQNAQAAIDLYGVGKGIALAAEAIDPTLVPFVTAGILIGDPLVAKAQLALTEASTDAAALAVLTTQITGQATALTVKGAPLVKVVAAS
jgi:hypothetical protein